MAHIGLPQPPPWRREQDEDGHFADPGHLRLHGFISKPEIQKLNRNSIYTFVNGRLIRDRLIHHALTEAYRNILPPTVFPVVLLFFEMPNAEVDVNVHPSKTEVRFRQQTVMHDFLRDSVRAALMKARPVPQFVTEIRAHATASPSLTPGARAATAEAGGSLTTFYGATAPDAFSLQAPQHPIIAERFHFSEGITVGANAALPVARFPQQTFAGGPQVLAGGLQALGNNNNNNEDHCAPPLPEEFEASADVVPSLSSLKPLGQLHESFILAVNHDGLWIIDQHVAHERVLFERVLKQRAKQQVESQRLLMPIVIELTPAQQAVFSEISDELQKNGFDAEPFGARIIAIKI